MKKNFIYLLLLFSIIAQAQVTPSYPTIKLTKTVEGVKQDSLLVLGTDKTVKHIPASKLGTVKSVTGIDGVTVANGTTNPIIGISSISQLKVVGLVTDLSNKVDKVIGKSLSDENYTLVEKNKLAGLSNFDPTIINNSIANKVDKVTGKSLIADAEIARLSTVVNQDISGKEDSFSKNTAFNKNFGVLANTVSEGNHLHSFSDLQNNPTTIAGYGITDANKAPINVNVTTVRTTAAKIGTTSSGTYVPIVGDRIDVTFTLGTAVANATLNIDGSGVKAIQLAGTNITALSLSTPASSTVIPMYYNGTAWQIYGSTMSADTNTTYIEATTGTVVTTSTQAVVANTLYYANNASNVDFTLPATCAINSIVHIIGMNPTGTYRIIAPSGDNIIIENNDTGSAGILNGSIRSTLVLRCTVANTTWSVVNYTGQIVSNTGYSTNKESTVNKSDSYSVSSTVTYPNTKALVDGLATKISGIGTTGMVQVSLGTGAIGNSSITDNGSVVATVLPIHANSFVKSTGSTNLLLANGNDITQASLPISTATQTALDLKANLASPALTGTPTAPTATAGTNTTQIANAAFVTSAVSSSLSNVVTLTTDQTITARKIFAGNLQMNSTLVIAANGSNFAMATFSGNANNVGSINTVALLRKNDKLAIMANDNAGTQRFAILDGSSLSSTDKTFTFPNQTGTFALTNNPTPLTATSFINSSAPTTNILLAGGSTLAQNTAFNKNFGTTAGTVVEGNYPPAKDGTGASGTWGINISGNASTATNWGGLAEFQDADNGNSNYIMVTTGGTGVWKYRGIGAFKTDLGLGSNAYSSTAFLPLSGGTMTGELSVNGKLKALCPIYANDAAADADATLLSGQFYKLTGSRAVYQKP